MEAQVSVLHIQQPKVSIYRGSGTSRLATITTAVPTNSTKDDPSPGQDKASADTPNEETDEPGKANNLKGMDALMPPLHTPPNSANGQATSSSQGEQHYRQTPSQPVAEDDCEAAMAKSIAEEDPASVTARESHDIHGKSKQQHVPHTGAQGGPADESVQPIEESHECNQQLLFTDVADIIDVPITYSTRGEVLNVSVAYNVFCVDIDPHDRHE